MTQDAGEQFLTLRESLSRRVLLAIEGIFDQVQSGKFSSKEGLNTIRVLIDTTMPFCDVGSVQTLSDIMTASEETLGRK